VPYRGHNIYATPIPHISSRTEVRNMAAADSTPVSIIVKETNNIAQPSQDMGSQLVKFPLDESLYSLGEEQAMFFKQQTGIQDDDELKRHVLEVQREAYDVC
jgi:hypothetical protein